MATKIISFDAGERLLDRRDHHPGDEALAELCECLSDLYPAFENLARAFPGCNAIGAFAGGEALGIVAFAPCRRGDHRSAGARKAVRELALIIANLNPDLRAAFEKEFEKEKAIRLKKDLRRERRGNELPQQKISLWLAADYAGTRASSRDRTDERLTGPEPASRSAAALGP